MWSDGDLPLHLRIWNEMEKKKKRIIKQTLVYVIQLFMWEFCYLQPLNNLIMLFLFFTVICIAIGPRILLLIITALSKSLYVKIVFLIFLAAHEIQNLLVGYSAGKMAAEIIQVDLNEKRKRAEKKKCRSYGFEQNS